MIAGLGLDCTCPASLRMANLRAMVGRHPPHQGFTAYPAPRIACWVRLLLLLSLSRVQLFVTPWTAEHQAPLSFAISQSLLKFTSIESVMLSISSSASPFSFCLQSFPASGSLPVSWFFASGGQSIGTSATVLPMSIQDCFPLGLSGLISLLSKGLHLY